MRLLYPIIWHGDIVVGSLFFHKVYANCDSELSLHCHIQYIVVSRIAPEPQCKFSFLVYACFRHLVKRLPEVTTIRWPRKKEQLLLWRGRSFGTKPAKHDKNEEKKRKIGLWGILVFLSLVTSKSKNRKKLCDKICSLPTQSIAKRKRAVRALPYLCLPFLGHGTEMALNITHALLSVCLPSHFVSRVHCHFGLIISSERLSFFHERSFPMHGKRFLKDLETTDQKWKRVIRKGQIVGL